MQNLTVFISCLVLWRKKNVKERTRKCNGERTLKKKNMARKAYRQVRGTKGHKKRAGRALSALKHTREVATWSLQR